MTIPRVAMIAALLLQRRRSDLLPAQNAPVLVIYLPPGVAVEGLPLVIGGSTAEYIAGLRRWRGEPD
jgi:hypothetical protein